MIKTILRTILSTLLLTACGTPTVAPALTVLPTAAPQPTRAPDPTQTLVPTFTPVPTLTPDPSIDHTGVAPLDKNTCPPEYPIKGNITDKKLYHTPGSSSYKATNPERCFATSADAEAAGFSRPSN